MIANILRLASTVAIAILLGSFGLFVVDQTRGGSATQVARISAATGPSDANPPTPSGAPAATKPGQPRALIDGGDRALVRPFTGLVKSSSVWVERGVPTLLALLVFGFGLRMLANYAIGVGTSSRRQAGSD